jgi:hypothetical protein
VRPADPAALLALPMTGPISAQDLAKTALPVLFARLLAREPVRGILTLAHGSRIVSVTVSDGRACVSRVEQQAAIQAFTWPEGAYSFEAKEVAAGLTQAPTSMARLVVEGLRVLGRSFTTEGMESALGSRLDQAPVIRAGATRTVGRLGLTAGELRLVEKGFDGIETGRSLLRGGLGKHTTLELLIVLALFGLVDWAIPKARESRPASEEPVLHARKMAAGNHFEALAVHWSASSAEIDAAHRALVAKIAPEGAWALAAPEACAQMRERAAEAYAVLRDPAARMAHRRAAYPLDYESIAELVDQQQSARSMREDEGGAPNQRSLAKELAQTAGPSAGRKISMATLLKAVAGKPRPGGGGGEGG